jgi:hypothetical protein
MRDVLERGLAELRAELSPSSADKARLRARILAPALGGGAAPALGGKAAPAPAPLARWAALKAAGSAGLAAGALVLGAGVGIGFWLGREASMPAASEPGVSTPARMAEPAPEWAEPLSIAGEAPSPPTTAAAPVVAPESPAAGRAPSRETQRPPPRRAARKSVAESPLDDELALLRRVERALRNADPALALALLAELDERFPDSRLVEERQAARLLADCRLGNGNASARARAFLSDHPASVYRQRVQLACALDTTSAPNEAAQPMKETLGPGH